VIIKTTVIRVLYSGDIDIIMPDETVKDRVYRFPSINELKIFKKDYLIKVSEILLNV
jgi:hypothetical protein